MAGYAFLLADADNTLFDFPAGERLALRQTFEAFGLPADKETAATYHRINEALWRQLERGEIDQGRLRVQRFAELFAALALREHPHVPEVAETFLQALGQQAILLPGAEQAMCRWSARVPVAIVTNGIASVQRTRVKLSPIARMISALIISEEVGAAKPDGRIVDAALHAIGCPDPGRALLLGDSLEADVAAALRAGVASCWFNPGKLPNRTPYHPTHTVVSLDEVDALLQQGGNNQ